MESLDDDLLDDEEAAYQNCPKCGRSFNEIDYDYRICSKCGWDAEKETFGDVVKPTKVDYDNGDADILTGRWN